MLELNFKFSQTIGTRFVAPPFFFNSSLLWDVFIINSVEQLQTLPKTQSEIDNKPISKNTKTLLYSITIELSNTNKYITGTPNKGQPLNRGKGNRVEEGFYVYRNGLISISD
jgi:hypothetical protein